MKGFFPSLYFQTEEKQILNCPYKLREALFSSRLTKVRKLHFFSVLLFWKQTQAQKIVSACLLFAGILKTPLKQDLKTSLWKKLPCGLCYPQCHKTLSCFKTTKLQLKQNHLKVWETFAFSHVKFERKIFEQTSVMLSIRICKINWKKCLLLCYIQLAISYVINISEGFKRNVLFHFFAIFLLLFLTVFFTCTFHTKL